MRIAIDNQIFCLQRFGGISRYFVELTNSLTRIYGEDLVKIFSPLHFNAYLANDEKSRRIYLKKTTDLFSFNSYIRSASTALARKHIKNFQPDLIHETFYSTKDLWELKIPRVLTVFDLVREKQNLNSEKVRVKRDSIKRAQHIICISENTKTELMNMYDIPNDRVSVIHLGVGQEFFRDSTTRRRKDILFVGQRADYKDFKTLLTSFSRIRMMFPEYRLVCFGGGKFTKSEIQLLETLGLNENSVCNFQGSDDLLINLYQQSEIFVTTSIDEGFGLPLLEALASGLKIICSDIAVYREIAGSFPSYFEPQNVEHLTELFIATLQNIDLIPSQFFQQGRDHAQKFTWGICAENTHAAYERVIAL